LIKSYQNKWVILGKELFWEKNQLKTTIEDREFGHTARSATSRFSLAGSSLTMKRILIQPRNLMRYRGPPALS
jgi:hypothetical protein